MNLEIDFEKKLDAYCKANDVLYTCYKDNIMDSNLNRPLIDCDYLAFVNPYKTIRLPKKQLVTLEWVLSKLYEQKEFVNLSKSISKLINTNMNCYPTSYGIGIFCFFGMPSDITDVESYLNKNNIEFINEYSQAHWVYRFKISKKNENIKKLKTLMNTSNN
jgi:hypothetical protein